MATPPDNYARNWMFTFKTREDYEAFSENETLTKRFKLGDPIIKEGSVITSAITEKRCWKSTL